MVSGPKKLIFHFCFYSNFLHFVIFCQMSPQSILCFLTKKWQKQMKPMVSETLQKREERCCCVWQHLICTHFWGWIHFLSNVSTTILFSKRSKNLTRTPFFHLFSPDFDAISRLTGGPNPLFVHFQKERAGRREFAGADGIPISTPLAGFQGAWKKVNFWKKCGR